MMRTCTGSVLERLVLDLYWIVQYREDWYLLCSGIYGRLALGL